MSTIILDGKEIANKVLFSVKTEGERLAKILKRPLKMVIVSVGEREDSKSYIKSKLKKAVAIGFDAENLALNSSVTQLELENCISRLSADNSVDGIILQLPISTGLDPHAAIEKIAPNKDLDGLCNHNKLITSNNLSLIPCTPLGVLKLIDHACLELDRKLDGLNAVVVGRSELVGKPTAELLLNRNCTVTICHSKTLDLERHLSHADVLVVAAGKANLINTVKKGSIVIDVGINSINNKIVGDVNFELVKELAAAITPVPGGVGPMTVAMLMLNLINAAKLSIK